MLKHLAPTGSPIKFFELFNWLSSALTGSGDKDKLLNVVKALLNREYSYLYSTGRGAMTVLLSAVKALNGMNGERNEVILPAYTCYSVASSAINAGLKIRLCDIDPNTLSYDMDKLRKMDLSRVVAIVSANLYGLPNDMVALENFAEEHGALLIDDAAQSLNSMIDGRHVGTFGYAGILSLDKGKNVTSMQGGLIVTNNDELADFLERETEQLSELSSKSKLFEFVKVFVYFLFLNPYAYKIPANISFSGLGETRFETEVEVKAYPDFLASLAIAQFKRIERITELRTARGEFYEKSLNPHPGVSKIARLESAVPVYLRYPLLIHDSGVRSDLLAQCREYGISGSYPKSLNMLAEIEAHLVVREACPGAECVARQIVTLPTHAFVTDNDAKSICEIVNKL
ncbi:MAG: DegT/DnrJ/EryC1/StrS family aminotransferase [Candidatus Thiodiazotropha sp. LLP2]